MEPSINGFVYSIIEGLGLATTEGHVGNGTLVGGLASRGVLSAGSGQLLARLSGSPDDTGKDVGHSARSVGPAGSISCVQGAMDGHEPKNLDSDDVGGLCNTIFPACNRAGAVRSMAIGINVLVILGDGLAPLRPTFELDVVDVDTSVDHVGINAFATMAVIDVLMGYEAGSVGGREKSGPLVGSTPNPKMDRSNPSQLSHCTED